MSTLSYQIPFNELAVLKFHAYFSPSFIDDFQPSLQLIHHGIDDFVTN